MNLLCRSREDSANASASVELRDCAPPCGVLSRADVGGLSCSIDSGRCVVFESLDVAADEGRYSLLNLWGGGVGRAFGGIVVGTSCACDDDGWELKPGENGGVDVDSSPTAFFLRLRGLGGPGDIEALGFLTAPWRLIPELGGVRTRSAGIAEVAPDDCRDNESGS